MKSVKNECIYFEDTLMTNTYIIGKKQHPNQRSRDPFSFLYILTHTLKVYHMRTIPRLGTSSIGSVISYMRSKMAALGDVT